MGDSHIYDTYEKEYKALYDTVSKKVSALKTSGISYIIQDQKKLLQNQIQRELEEAEEIVPSY
jgi:vesicle transport through interaction with t-SNAREs protein 1